ncbi:hypothetical protein [Salinarimonas soli]|uniref:hypothetical protein n=1 Tax=Salinarimonas soli TaxID=1638099 RepID=UPI001661D7A6|nr:hypothetical protein [Salinarimonas soli]
MSTPIIVLFVVITGCGAALLGCGALLMQYHEERSRGAEQKRQRLNRRWTDKLES